MRFHMSAAGRGGMDAWSNRQREDHWAGHREAGDAHSCPPEPQNVISIAIAYKPGPSIPRGRAGKVTTASEISGCRIQASAAADRARAQVGPHRVHGWII